MYSTNSFLNILVLLFLNKIGEKNMLVRRSKPKIETEEKNIDTIKYPEFAFVSFKTDLKIYV